MGLQGIKVAILIEDLYQDQEVWYPLYRLREEGAAVTVVGPGRAKEYKSKYGFPIKEDLSIDKAVPGDFDGVIVPGGYSPDHMRRNPAFAQFAKAIAAEGKPVGSICHGPWLLISAGVVKGKRVTGFFSIKDDLVNAGARYEDAEVVQDGCLITSRVPDDLPAFMKAYLAALGARSAAHASHDSAR